MIRSANRPRCSGVKALRRSGLIDLKAEAALAELWKQKMAIRTPDVNNNILTLSGGNQQKALFARAYAISRRIQHNNAWLRPDLSPSLWIKK